MKEQHGIFFPPKGKQRTRIRQLMVRTVHPKRFDTSFFDKTIL